MRYLVILMACMILGGCKEERAFEEFDKCGIFLIPHDKSRAIIKCSDGIFYVEANNVFIDADKTTMKIRL